MAHTFRHDEALPRRKIDNAILKVDQELSIENKKEFIECLYVRANDTRPRSQPA
jgi:hypothetical protein